MRCTHLLLDLDGTLTDPFSGISRCIEYALESLGTTVPDASALRQWIGPPLKQSFECYLESQGGGDADRAVSLYRERFARIGLYENSVYPGIPHLLECLHGRSVRLFLATSKPLFYARQIIDHFGLEPWFEGVYGSEMDGRRTDKVDLLRYIMKQEKLHASECIMVGDRKFDVAAACSHSMGAIGVLWGYGTAVELLEAGAETLVASPQELMNLLLENQD